MNITSPRVVVVTRKTEYELLLGRHATRGQAEFFLSSRQQSLATIEARHENFESALNHVMNVIPTDWRRNRVTREDLDRFLFEPQDLVIVVGQDGLVANVAKYLNQQPVIGVNPDMNLYDGILTPFAPNQIGKIIKSAMQREMQTQSRAMVQAILDDKQTLLALNEVFLGHRSHQSAGYVIQMDNSKEHHSSSGLIVFSGTGATGWAHSIHRERNDQLNLPKPEDNRLTFYVREAFPSVKTGTSMTSGNIEKQKSLFITSKMNDGGIIFGDGIESDYLEFNWGRQVEITLADRTLELVCKV